MNFVFCVGIWIPQPFPIRIGCGVGVAQSDREREYGNVDQFMRELELAESQIGSRRRIGSHRLGWQT
jgi:hypothetical protein